MIWGGLLRLALVIITVLFHTTLCFDLLNTSKRDINAGDISSLFNYIENGTFSVPPSMSQQKNMSDLVKFLGNCTVSWKQANQRGPSEGRNSLHDNFTISINVGDLQGLKIILEKEMKASPLKDMLLTALATVSNKSQNEENYGQNAIDPSSNLTNNLFSALYKPNNSICNDNQNKSFQFSNDYYSKIPNEENCDSYIYSFNLTFKDMATAASMLRDIWNNRSYQHIYKNEPDNGLAIKDDDSFTGADLNKKGFIILKNANFNHSNNSSDVNYIANNLSLENSHTDNKTVKLVIPVTVDSNNIINPKSINQHEIAKVVKPKALSNSSDKIDKILNGCCNVSEDRASLYSQTNRLTNNNNNSFLFATDNNDSFVSHPESKAATNLFQAEGITNRHLVPQVTSSYKNPLPGLLFQIGKLLPNHVLEGLMKKENNTEPQTNPYRDGWLFVQNGSISNTDRSILNPEINFPAVFSLQTSIFTQNVLSTSHLQKEITEPFVYNAIMVNVSSNQTDKLANFVSNDTIQTTTACDVPHTPAIVAEFSPSLHNDSYSTMNKTKTPIPVHVPLYVQNISLFIPNLPNRTVHNSTTSLNEPSTQVILTTHPTAYLQNTVSVFSTAITSSNSTVVPPNTILNETVSSISNTINVTSVRFNVSSFISDSTVQYYNNTNQFYLSSLVKFSNMEFKPAMNVTPANGSVVYELTRPVEDDELYRRIHHIHSEAENPDSDSDGFLSSLPALSVAKQCTRMIKDLSGQNLTNSTTETLSRNVTKVDDFNNTSKAVSKMMMFQALPTVVADSSTEPYRDECNKTNFNKTKRDESIYQVTQRSQYYFNDDAADISVIDRSKIDVTEYTTLKVKDKENNTANFSLIASLQVDFNTTDHGKVSFNGLELSEVDFTEREYIATSRDIKTEPYIEQNYTEQDIRTTVYVPPNSSKTTRTGKKNTPESTSESDSDKYLPVTGIKDTNNQLLDTFKFILQPLIFKQDRQQTAPEFEQPIKINNLFYYTIYKSDRQLSTVIYFYEKQALFGTKNVNTAANRIVKKEELCNNRNRSELEYRETQPKLRQSNINTDNYFGVNRVSTQRNSTRLGSNILGYIETSVKNSTQSYKMNSSERPYDNRTTNSAVTVKYQYDKINNKNFTVPTVQYNIYKLPVYTYSNATNKPAFLVSSLTKKVELRNEAVKFDYAINDQLHRNISTKKSSLLTTPICNCSKNNDQNKQATQINSALKAPNNSFLNRSSYNPICKICYPSTTVVKTISKNVSKENSTFVQSINSFNNFLPQKIYYTSTTIVKTISKNVSKENSTFVRSINSLNNFLPQNLSVTINNKNGDINSEINKQTTIQMINKLTMPWSVMKNSNNNFPVQFETTTEQRNYNTSDHRLNTESALYTNRNETKIPDKMNKYDSVNYTNNNYYISVDDCTAKNTDTENLHNRTSTPEQSSSPSFNTSEQIPTNKSYFLNADNSVNRNQPIEIAVVLSMPKFRPVKMDTTENHGDLNKYLFNNGKPYNSSTGHSETVDNNANITRRTDHDLSTLQSMNQIRNTTLDTTAGSDRTSSKETFKTTTSSPYVSDSDGAKFTVFPVETSRAFKENDSHEFAYQNKPEQSVDYTRTTEKKQVHSQNPGSTKTFFINLPLVTQFPLKEAYYNTKNFNRLFSERKR